MASLQSTKTIVSAVDGSEMAHRAFQIAMHIRQSQDRLIVLHCADRRKEFLPRDLKPEHIMEFYENELIAAVNFSSLFPPFFVLCNFKLLNDHKPSFFFFFFYFSFV